MKIKLVLAADENDPLGGNNPFKPLSLTLLAAAAPDHDYELVDMLKDPESGGKGDFDLVGISVRRSAEKAAFDLADRFRERGTAVVMGGPQVSARPFEALKHADSVVVGEGEELWKKLLSDIENKDLKSFYVSSPVPFNANGNSVYRLPSMPDLGKIPKPKRNLIKGKYDFELVFASRGCAVNCDFCSVTRLFGNRYRLRPAEDVVSEIKEFKGYYYLIDDTVFGRNNTYDYYLELYGRIAALKKIRYWTGQANLDAAASEKGRIVIQKAVKAGLLYAAIGMESINEPTLKKSGSYAKIGVKNSGDMIRAMKENIRFIQQQGIFISAWFAIGYEDDTVDTYYQTLDFCTEMNLIPVFTPVHALPGTDLYDRLSKEGKLQDDNFHISNMSHSSINDQNVIEALEFVNRKGFGFAAVARRTWYYFRIFVKQKGNTVNDIIHKTIFILITQLRFGRITREETKKLKQRIKN